VCANKDPESLKTIGGVWAFVCLQAGLHAPAARGTAAALFWVSTTTRPGRPGFCFVAGRRSEDSAVTPRRTAAAAAALPPRDIAAAAFRLPALMNLYIHPLYDLSHSWTSIFILYTILVSKILSSILNSLTLIYPLYHPLSTLSTVGPTCHFI
jgi:hypothetical protein